MSKIITVPFTEDFIEALSEYVHSHYLLKGKDLRSVALIFGGQRPALFLKRSLAKKVKGVFYPPTFFSIDQWMERIVSNEQSSKRISQLDHYYLIYQLAQSHAPQLLKGKERFCSFLPWAKEIHALIEQLDLELTSQDILSNLKAQAQIGFDIPVDIGQLLESLFVLRKEYHRHLEVQKISSRGFQYMQASQMIQQQDLSQWQEIIFCNFFYLHRSEMKMVEHCYKQANTTMLMQGDERRWPALKRISSVLEGSILEGPKVIEGDFKLKLHSAFDGHSQAALVKKILHEIKNPEETVIVLPQSDFILPLLSFLSTEIKEFNVSMGYPLKRSALYALLEKIFAAQKSMQKDLYYTRDYLRVLRHPLVKDLNLADSTINRHIVGAIEDICTGQIMSEFSGQLFLNLRDFGKDPILLEIIQRALQAQEIRLTDQELLRYIEALHESLFYKWQGVTNFAQLSLILGEFTALMRTHSQMSEYPFNEKIALAIQTLSQELSSSEFAKQNFMPTEMFRILEDTLGAQMISFTGSPLRGLQILGLFETRALTFKNVIVLDVNESILPNLNIYEPLIPRDIMIKLDLDRLELEEEIQRYGFMRLISSAQEVHLIYQERSDRIRSRFIEELIWNEERSKGELGVIDIHSGRFEVKLASGQRSIPKTPAMVEFLKGMRYSASSLNTYLRNPYEFYENYILGLREGDNLLDDPQGKHVGIFVHELLEKSFKSFVNKKPVIDDEFKKHFMGQLSLSFEANFGRKQRSDAFLLKSVLDTRMERFLNAEARRCHQEVESVLSLEQKFNHVLELSGRQIKLTYRMDRIDRLLDGSVLVMDYKTGGQELMPKSFDELLDGNLSREIIRDQLLSFQMPLYLYYLQGVYPNALVNAAFFQLRTNKLEKFLKTSNEEQINRVVKGTLRSLDFIISELLNPEIPFTDSPVEKDD